jgi:multidrug efflux pump subunit AcrA (membrane-fusion protein)
MLDIQRVAPPRALIVWLVIFASLFVSCSKPAKDGPVGQAGQVSQPVAAPGGSSGAQRAGGSAPGGAGQGGTGGQPGGRRHAIVPVQATAAQSGLLTAERTTAGVVGPVTQSQVAAQIAGVVKSVLRVSGDWVKPGDVVVQLDDAQLRLTFANAQATLENAKINLSIGQDNSDQANPKLALQVKSAQSALDSAQKYYDSQKALFDLGGISASALDTAASQLSSAQANLEGAKTALDQNSKSGDQAIAQLKLAVTQAQNQLSQAQLNLQYTSIRAPFAGQIAAMNMQSGMYVGLNTPVFTLVSRDRQISFSVAPSDAPALPNGKAIGFTYNGVKYPIKVSQAPSAPINGVIPLIASVPASFGLPFGTVGSVSYTVGVASGVLVPLNALGTLENRTYVFKIVDDRATTVNVTILGESGITTAVDGIRPGDVIVVNPPPGLIQGSQVQMLMIGQGAPQGQGTRRPSGPDQSGQAAGNP